MKNNYIKSFINYQGNKYKLLPQILPLFPKEIDTFVDLFCGSGTVGLSVQANRNIYNDINNKIVDILYYVKQHNIDDIICDIETIIMQYQLSKTNEDGFKELRHDYNVLELNPIALYTLMCYSFNYQCRFNNKGEYNSSFGRNRSSFTDNQRSNLIKCSEVLKGQYTTFGYMSFEDFYYDRLMGGHGGDFVYIDPPYYGTIGSYNDGNRLFGDWTLEKELELHRCVEYLDEKRIKFAISNNFTVNKQMKDFAESRGYNIHHLDMSYGNSNYQKKEKAKDDEVLITNY